MRGDGPAAASGIAVSVHGPAGVLDLLVPTGSAVGDVARAYAARAGLAAIPLVHTRNGDALPADSTLGDAGVGTGAVLVASTGVHGERRSAPHRVAARSTAGPGRLSVLWFSVASALACLSGWSAGRSDPSALRTLALVLLLAAAVIGVLPLGRMAAHRALAAPSFGAAAALGLVWDPHPERLPTVLGITALAGAVTAAVARALDERVEEGLRVWIVSGVSVFVVTTLVTLAGLPASVTWALLLVGAMLAARFVPALVVDVPDQLLIDLERLAVTAWSARERPRGRRGRVVASPESVTEVARRGARLITASCVAIAVLSVASSWQLLSRVSVDLDRTGARFLVLFAGAALLLAARSYRHTACRGLLRSAGLTCSMLLVGELLRGPAPGPTVLVAGVAIVLAAALVVVAVATGRGWRSAWWARRAEVAEGLSGAAALASVLVATGLFRTVWELGSRAAT